MWFLPLLILALAGQGMALEASISIISTSPASSASTDTTSSTAKSNPPAVTVAQDGSGQFTAINEAILYAQTKSLPTVTIKAGTYTETVVISATATVTVEGETSASGPRTSDYAINEVIIKTNSSTVAALSFGTSASKGITWRNINFVNPSTTSIAGAVSLRGYKQAFYGCQFVAAGTVAITSSYASALIAYSYIEAADKAIYSYPSLYIFDSTITVTASNGLLVYNRGAVYSTTGVLYNSTVIFDSCSVIQKTGYINTNVYLAAASSAGATVLYRNSSLPSSIAAAGAHNDTTTIQYANRYMEFRTTGSGSYARNANSRTGLVTLITDPSDLAPYELLAFLSSQYPTVATTSTNWIDADVLAAIEDNDNMQEAEATSTYMTTSISAASSVSTAASAMAATTSVSASSAYTVAPTPTAGQYGTVASAIAALPSDGEAYVIYILAGTYKEQISINRTGLVTLKGETTFPNDFTQNTVTIQFSSGKLTSANSDETTPVINAKKTDGSGLALYNIDFTNTYPQTTNTAALAADFYGAKFAAYGCSFKGYQDTLLVNQGVQVFSNCYVEGSVDFIWGYSKAYFHQCYISSNTGAGSAITAQNKPSATWAGGFVFDTCYVTYTSTYGATYGLTYLGRPWSQYAVVVYMNSYLDKHINSDGWEQWSTSTANTENVTFGEFNNSGPGSWTTTNQRAAFATNLTSAEAAAYSLGNFIGATSWLDQTAYSYVPSYNLSVTTTSTTTTANSTTSTAVWAHPTSGTSPPAGAVLVSVGGSVDESFSNLTAALASLPSDTSTQIIFIYPGYYVEQVPSINREGPVMIIGYTTASSGWTYKGNTVSIAYARGLSVSPLPTGHSDAETAVITTTSTTISMYNVDVVNSENLDGETSSYVTLAASIASTHTGFYGCSFIGWQDTLLTNTKTGYQYYESCYIEGAIDFIWGYSKAYFKGCTIGAKRKNSCVTAQSRASELAIGGYIFDQCLFTAAANATVDLTHSVYLGRPYSKYAEVVVKNSYLDELIAPAGWKIWSTSSPNTDNIAFAEYNNSGPGNWQNNIAARVAFQNCTLLDSDTYPLTTVMDSIDWIDMTHWDSITTPQAASASTTTTTTIGNTTNSTWVYDGTVPPQGAFVVSKTAIANVTTYDTIQSALDALPTSSKIIATVFIYPGTYEEQLVLDKPGTTIFLGYSNDTSDHNANTVTISYNSSVDTQADESNSDSATVYVKGNYFQAVNINFANTFGTSKDYASLGFGVASSKYASLYGCQVYGNQDALLVNGYFFSFNSYIEGNIDMIWGAGAGYFLGSTISPNEDGINLTADKRLTNTTAAGFVFDQCTVTPAEGATFTKISLGRPWNSNARVAYVESDLGSCIEAAGWNQWSSSSPETDGVLFGEYNNYGAGSGTTLRASFSTQLTPTEAEQFELTSFFSSIAWVNMTLVDITPFSANSTLIVSTTTSTSSITSTSTSVASSALTTTSLITVTAYTTKQTTAKETTTTTTTAPDTTTTIAETTTIEEFTTITSATTKTLTALTTTTDITVLTEPHRIITETSVVLSNGAVTVTASPITKTSTDEVTVLLTSTKTTTAKATTVMTTATITSTVTGRTEKASTTTMTIGTTTTVTYISTPKSATVTSATTVTVGTGGTTTTTAKATTVTVTMVTTKTKTVKSTTTVTCTTAVKMKRTDLSGLSGAAVAVRWAELHGRAELYVTTTSTSTALSTLTTEVKTQTVTLGGSAYTTKEIEATSTKGKVTTLEPSTVTVTTTSVVTKETIATLDGSVSTAWTTTTATMGKATTLKASTSTLVVTQTKTTATVWTLSEPSSTLTSVKTRTVKTTTTPAMFSTSTKTVTDNDTAKTTSTLARSTVTSIKTTTFTLRPSVTVTSQSTKTTTAKSKITVTTTVWSTTTKKGALTCTA